MSSAKPPVKCPHCDVGNFTNYYQYQKHRKEAHGIGSLVKKPKHSENPLDTIHAAEKVIGEAIKFLDFRRTELMNEIRELDDTIAKYKRITQHA